MMMTDPIADMLTRVRNANRNLTPVVSMPVSKMKVAIAQVLTAEGYIEKYEETGEGVEKKINLHLKYNKGKAVITGLKKISKPGLRVYCGKSSIPRVLGGLGVAVLSTNKGILAGKKAKEANVGGEVLFHIW
ncbi:MAG: 30S ribosomal protein S8 [Candidatus Cloacimonadota bacterium]|nr:MAG: 30S ribosomal protein S8 [Candidatus Cloacimonadota bacterium]